MFKSVVQIQMYFEVNVVWESEHRSGVRSQAEQGEQQGVSQPVAVQAGSRAWNDSGEWGKQGLGDEGEHRGTQ